MASNRIGSAKNLQTGGTYDLLLVKMSGVFPEGKITFGVYDTPKKITGIQKVAQGFLKTLLTSKGSDPFYPEKGTYFPNLMVGSNITEDDQALIADVVQAVRDASSQVRSSMNVNTEDLASSLDTVEVLGVDRVNEGWFVVLNLQTLAGENAEIAVPFPEEIDKGSTNIAESAATPAPIVDFVGIPRSGYAPLAVDFYDLSTGLPNRWDWDFQMDGSIDSHAKNPSFTYPDPGVYPVSLTTYNSFGSGTASKIDYITVLAPIPPAPTEILDIVSFEVGEVHPYLSVAGAQIFSNSSKPTAFPPFPSTSNGTRFAANWDPLPLRITVVGPYMIKKIEISLTVNNNGVHITLHKDTAEIIQIPIVGVLGINRSDWTEQSFDLSLPSSSWGSSFPRCTYFEVGGTDVSEYWGLDYIRVTLIPYV